jgi:hypothetical protein
MPAASTTTARLRVVPRATDLTIVADPTIEQRYAASWDGPEPAIEERDDDLDVRYSFRGRLAALAGGALTLRLNPAYTWEIEIEGGVSGLRADLRELRVASIVVSGGAKDVEFHLPAPDGELPLRIAGGVGKALVRRPEGVPVAVEIDGGASNLRVDDEKFGAIGGKVRMAVGGGDNRVALRILGGASRLTVAQ